MPSSLSEPIPRYKQLGCYVALKNKRNKAFNLRYMSFRDQIIDNKTTIERCLRVAVAKGFTYFSVRNLADCWSDQKAEENYDKLGPSQFCHNGVGDQRRRSMMVYKITGKKVSFYAHLLAVHSLCALSSPYARVPKDNRPPKRANIYNKDLRFDEKRPLTTKRPLE